MPFAMESCLAHMYRPLVLYFTSGKGSVTSACFFTPQSSLPGCRLEVSSPVSTLAAVWKISSVTVQQAGHFLIECISPPPLAATGSQEEKATNMKNGIGEIVTQDVHADLRLFSSCTILNRQLTRGGATHTGA